MPLLTWLARRVQAVKDREREVDRRVERTRQMSGETRQAVDRAARLAREMKEMGRALR